MWKEYLVTVGDPIVECTWKDIIATLRNDDTVVDRI